MMRKTCWRKLKSRTDLKKVEIDSTESSSTRATGRYTPRLFLDNRRAAHAQCCAGTRRWNP